MNKYRVLFVGGMEEVVCGDSYDFRGDWCFFNRNIEIQGGRAIEKISGRHPSRIIAQFVARNVRGIIEMPDEDK
jgi:hypothetical protein